MKIDKLKSMIKEAVREAVREEIKEILTEAVSTASTPVRQESKPIVQKVQKPRFKAKGDPIMEMLNMTQQSMTRDDFKNVMGGQAQPGMQSMNFNSNSVPMSTPTGPQHGIDISQLDFVNKAATVYQKSLEKDKFRVGA